MLEISMKYLKATIKVLYSIAILAVLIIIAVNAKPVAQRLGAYFNQTSVEFADTNALDAFGRLRTSAPHTVFDIQNEYNSSDLWAQTSSTGGGNVSFLPNESTVSLNVGTASGDKVIRQTKQYFRYSSGKSQVFIGSRVFNAQKTNLVQRTGQFDTQNGLFFEASTGTLKWVVRSYASGSIVDTQYLQSDWNLDKLDGSGASGVNLDITKTNIYFIDYEWLGSGRIRFGIIGPKGTPIYAHEVDNANNNTAVYMTTANLPMRSEIENVGATATSSSLKKICSAIMNENGFDPTPLGIDFSASNGTTTIAVTTRRAIISIRPKATFAGKVNRAYTTDFDYQIFSDANAYYELVWNGTVGGSPSWGSVDSSSTMEYDVAGTTVTGGIVIDSGFVGVGFRGATGINKELLSKLPLTLDMDGNNPINLSLIITSFTGTANASGVLSWKEIY